MALDFDRDLIAVTFDYAVRIDNGRDVDHVVKYAMTELAELSTEIMISESGVGEPGKDGVIGEAIDLAVCALDLMKVYEPGITSEEAQQIANKCLEEWAEECESKLFTFAPESSNDFLTDIHYVSSVISGPRDTARLGWEVTADLGILTEELLIVEGSSYKEPRPGGLQGAAMRLAIRCIEMCYVHGKGSHLTPDDVMGIARRKLEKWELKHSEQVGSRNLKG